MRDNRQEVIGLAVDLEVEPVPVIHFRLQNVARLVVLLGSKRWMSKIGKQKAQLLVRTWLDARRTDVDIAYENGA